jgi:hypothetical protein
MGLMSAGFETAHFQPEGHVFFHGQVGKQGIALKHGIHRTLEGQLAGQRFAIQADVAAADILETGNHAQQGGLATAGRPSRVKNSFSRMLSAMLSSASTACSSWPKRLQTWSISIATRLPVMAVLLWKCSEMSMPRTAAAALAACREWQPPGGCSRAGRRQQETAGGQPGGPPCVRNGMGSR